MIKSFLKKTKNLLFSLRMGFIVVFLVAMAIGVGVFFLGRMIAANYIDNVYVAEENKKAREEGYLRDLQEFINDNKISSAETGKISEWARENQYVYLLIYKDDKIFFTSDDATEEEMDDNTDGDGSIGGGEGDALPDEKEFDEFDKNTDKENGEEEGEDEKPTPPNFGVTVDYPTREELFEYARRNDMHLIELSDGPLFASFAEFTEYLYYDITNIFSLVAAALIVVLIMLVYIKRVTARIVKLGQTVNLVRQGDTECRIVVKGSDEISSLAANVDEMRNSLVETLKKEREALDSNTELITSMSHDIRTPLTVLLGYIDVMQNHAEGDEVMQGYIKAAESTALRLKKLSDDMFSYFLVFGDNKVNAEIESYDAETLIAQMLSEHVLLMKENGYDTEFRGEKESPLLCKIVRTDAQKLVRIFDNAFSNIYKYADKNFPVEIEIRAEACDVIIRIENVIRTDNKTVESNGIGLKTCSKLAEMIGAKFSHGAVENKYFVNISLPIEDGKERE